MNGCGTNAHLIYLSSSVSHSQCAPLLQHKFSVCYLYMSVYVRTRTGQTGVCLTLTCVCIVCMMPFTLCTKRPRATGCSRGIYTQSYSTTPQHQGQQKVRKRDKSQANRQRSLKISSLADSGSYGSQLAKRTGGKQA